ncbi:MAG: hypothetical protein J1D77_00915 [Muribaculaceae bacterium]|nr:hypothetical protein [Muribaculaceae bacterium]
MDKKRFLTKIFITLLGLTAIFSGRAQTPAHLEFNDRSYSYEKGNDSIKIYFNLTGPDGKRILNMSPEAFRDKVRFLEDGREIQNGEVRSIVTGVRVPNDYTFSILLDRSIPAEGKVQILKSVKNFLDITPDSTVFVSFFGDEVSNSILASRQNIGKLEQAYMVPSIGKSFYSGIHSKLAEFSPETPDFMSDINALAYVKNSLISHKAAQNPGKNFLIVFVEGNTRPDDEALDFITMSDYQSHNAEVLPKVFAFYYTEEGEDARIRTTLEGLTHPQDSTRNVIERLRGQVAESKDMGEVLQKFQTVIEGATYDYVLAYEAPEDKTYAGNINYEAKSGENELGRATFTIGSAEKPWPERQHTSTSFFLELFVGIGITAVTLIFYLLVMKVVVPWIRQLRFRHRYYSKYKPQANVRRLVCALCRQPIEEGDRMVTKCKDHPMHIECWQDNGYKCVAYGQNCRDSAETRVNFKELFSRVTLRDLSQTIAGVIAGLVSWVIYELFGRGGFNRLSEWIVSIVFGPDDFQSSLIVDCVARTSAFLMIGMLLGFFISLIFRYRDDVRDKDWRIWGKIVLLSFLSSFIGMLSFAIGADLFCVILRASGKLYIPWYCSLPAYVIFSLAVSLSLTIKSTIPLKSALWGGIISAVIGFWVLYFTEFTSQNYQWVNILLDFIIYGGGLGASLVTVRMLSERYFLEIQNGLKEGTSIPIHKWMESSGGGRTVVMGLHKGCEIEMNWEKDNKVAKEHVHLYKDKDRKLTMLKPLDKGVILNNRVELSVNQPVVLNHGDTFQIGDTVFKYVETYSKKKEEKPEEGQTLSNRMRNASGKQIRLG